jgi:hypothetical protein
MARLLCGRGVSAFKLSALEVNTFNIIPNLGVQRKSLNQRTENGRQNSENKLECVDCGF